MTALVALHLLAGVTYTEMLEMTASQMLALMRVLKRHMDAIKTYKSLEGLKRMGGYL